MSKVVPFSRAAAPPSPPPPSSPPLPPSLSSSQQPSPPLVLSAPVARRSLAAVEREHILGMVVLCCGNRSEAARVLGIDRRTLHRKLARYAKEK